MSDKIKHDDNWAMQNIKMTTIHDEIIKLKKDIENSFIRLGAYLKLVRDNKLYKDRGCETFEEYIAQPELSFERRTVYSVIGVYEDFIDKPVCNQPHIEEIGYVKLDRIRQFKGRKDFPEWIEKARTLSLSDLNEEIHEAKGTLRTIDPSDIFKVRNVTCPNCGFSFQIKEVAKNLLI